ncbi:NAD(P)/FAD-dependent oxidoreductase [Natronosalvus caseinilyticus]|uniref:NAD(P)/FAD-dependent oxidoreductase n=1 Tax=Natronosalvus caseinilyticus TaxID=2953747 RepID=UPI0028B15D44|nr:FAD-binding oxidoreductase [Natronosalvus caseinilyticus]
MSGSGLDAKNEGAETISEHELAVGADAFVDRGAGLEVAVVGAGAVGATAAYDLAREGADVTLYEKGQVAGGSSGRAAGVCYNAFADDLDAEIGAAAIERFRSLSSDDTFPFVECPYVWLAREGDERRAAHIREGIEAMQSRGVVALEVDADELAERFPHLRTDDVAVAGIAGAAGYTDPARYTACLAAAASGAGATVETDAPVEVRVDPPRVVREGTEREREFDAVLVAAGGHTKAVLEAAGLPIAMKPYRVQAMTATGDLPEPMCYDATDGFYARPHPDGLLAGNGTEEREIDPDDYERGANPGFADELCERVAHRFPEAELGEAEITRAWAGVCTATPDGDPLVGERHDGLYVATGFQGHGFMRAPAIGARIADEILGGEGIPAFDPTRFTGTESFDVVEGMAIEDEPR